MSSAQSARVTLKDADRTGQDIVIRLNRDATKSEPYTGTYNVGQPIRKSTTTLSATFYSLPNQDGVVVGTATAAVQVSTDKVEVASITVVGTVKTVSVIPPAELRAGTAAVQLNFSALNESGAAVAVTPGSAKWAVISGGTSLSVTEDGVATPLAAGTATVSATVDGISSTPLAITVKAALIGSPAFQITWPARTRESLNHGLTSAQSALVTLKDASPQGADIQVRIDRESGRTEQYTETYPVGQPVSSGVRSLTATFYALPDQQGAVVGTATATVNPTGNLLDLGSIVVVGTIRQVTVVPPATLAVGGAPVQLQFSAKNESGDAVAVTPGSARWTVVNGAANLTVTPDGVATAVAPGTATVTVTVDGVTSAAQAITVIRQTQRFIVDVPVGAIDYDEVSGKIWATVLSTGGTYANSVVSINPATGALGTPISIGAQPHRITVSENGQYAFVTVDADATVRRVDLINRTVGPTININGGSPMVDIVAVPGSPNSFAIANDPQFGVNVSVWDNGVRRSGTGAGGNSLVFGGSDAVLYGQGGNSLFKNTLTATSINWVAQTDGLAVGSIDYANGLIYTATGQVIDPEAKTVVHQFAQTNFLVDKGVAVSQEDNRAYFVTWSHNVNKRILAFDLTTRQELPFVDAGALPGGALNLIAAGPRTVAFHLFGEGVKRQVVIVRGLP